jgi:hypothetical protein
LLRIQFSYLTLYSDSQILKLCLVYFIYFVCVFRSKPMCTGCLHQSFVQVNNRRSQIWLHIPSDRFMTHKCVHNMKFSHYYWPQTSVFTERNTNAMCDCAGEHLDLNWVWQRVFITIRITKTQHQQHRRKRNHKTKCKICIPRWNEILHFRVLWYWYRYIC